MDIRTKLHYVEQQIKNISRADDTDSAIRTAALDAIAELIESEREAMRERTAAAIVAMAEG